MTRQTDVARHGSRELLQILINETPQSLERELRSTQVLRGDVQWLSPLASDRFRMYRDNAFLDRLDVQLARRSLRDFWPARGPRWGALGRSGTTVLLVEGVTGVAEFDTACQATSSASRRKISSALSDTRSFLGAATSGADWTSRYYQYANRLAHLYLLRELNDLDAFLVIVHFLSPSTPTPFPPDEWEDAMSELRACLGLPAESEWLSANVRDVFIDPRAFDDLARPPTHGGDRRHQPDRSSLAVVQPRRRERVPLTVSPQPPGRRPPKPVADRSAGQPVAPNSHSHAPALTFEGIDQAIVLDIKTTGPDPDRDRVVAVAMINVSLPEILREGGTPTEGGQVLRSRYNPGQPISHCASRRHGIPDADVENRRALSEDAAELRSFIGDLPIIEHASDATAFLGREFQLAGVESLQGNPVHSTKARFERDTQRRVGSGLEQVATALRVRKSVTSFDVDEHTEDVATILLVALHFWILDNPTRVRAVKPPARRRLVSDNAFRTLLKVLTGIGAFGLLAKGTLAFRDCPRPDTAVPALDCGTRSLLRHYRRVRCAVRAGVLGGCPGEGA